MYCCLKLVAPIGLSPLIFRSSKAAVRAHRSCYSIRSGTWHQRVKGPHGSDLRREVRTLCSHSGGRGLGTSLCHGTHRERRPCLSRGVSLPFFIWAARCWQTYPDPQMFASFHSQALSETLRMLHSNAQVLRRSVCEMRVTRPTHPFPDSSRSLSAGAPPPRTPGPEPQGRAAGRQPICRCRARTSFAVAHAEFTRAQASGTSSAGPVPHGASWEKPPPPPALEGAVYPPPKPLFGVMVSPASHSRPPPNGPPTALYPPDIASQPLFYPPVTARATALETPFVGCFHPPARPSPPLPLNPDKGRRRQATKPPTPPPIAGPGWQVVADWSYSVVPLSS